MGQQVEKPTLASRRNRENGWPICFGWVGAKPLRKAAKSAMEAYKAAESADALADTKKGSERRGDVRYA
jgi:hypothetical protein